MESGDSGSLVDKGGGFVGLAFAGSDTLAVVCKAEHIVNGLGISMEPLTPNEPPVAEDQSVTTNEETPVSITLTATDPDGDTLTYSIVSGPSNGMLTGEAPSVTYTPDSNYYGEDSFTFKANDGKVDSNIATVSVTVSPVNDAPVADDQSVTATQSTSIDITLTASDVDGDSLSYSIVSGPLHGSLSGTAPSVTYTPETDYTGSDSFTFKASDGQEYSNIATVSITVTKVNNPPVANDQSVITNEDTAVDITLTATDPDDDPLTYTVVTLPANGELTGTAPYLTYTPNLNFYGSDSFTFKACDGQVDSNIAIVTITVNPVNDPPVASGIPDVSFTEGGSDNSIDLDNYVTDVDNTPAEITWTRSGATNVIVSIDPDTHVVTLTAVAGWTGSETIIFTGTDLGGLSDSDDSKVTVNPAAPPTEEFTFTGTVPKGGEDRNTVTVKSPGATSMYVKLTWAGWDDLRLRVYNPAEEMVAEVDKSSRRNKVEEITIENLEAGDWQVAAYSESRRRSIDYTIEGVVNY